MGDHTACRDSLPQPLLRSMLLDRTHSEPLHMCLDQKRHRPPAGVESETPVMVDSRGNAAGDLSKVHSQPNLPALAAQDQWPTECGLSGAQSYSRTRKRSWAGLRPAEMKSSNLRLARRWPEGSLAQAAGRGPPDSTWQELGIAAAGGSLEDEWASSQSNFSADPAGWRATGMGQRAASSPLLDDAMDTELTPSQKIIAELLAQHAAARAQGRPIMMSGRNSKVSSPAGGASNRSSLTGAPEMCSPFSLSGPTRRCNTGSEQQGHPAPQASLSGPAIDAVDGFNEALVLEDLYLNAPGFTSMLQELASSDTAMHEEA
ncbi:hypothetical protein WJX84_006455 [Apatococcus fuscideae]|uniref:Uncharacterized protein n=1 Tax=Apatococcus fuscideae TaxID=2026836 RepID=A0AAW1SVF9_9CHLO